MNIVLSATFGIICGFILELGNIIRLLSKYNKYVTILTDIIFSCSSGFILLYLLFHIYNGFYRIFDILAFIIGTIIYRISIGNLFASSLNNVYNRIKNRRGNHSDKQKQNTNC